MASTQSRSGMTPEGTCVVYLEEEELSVFTGTISTSNCTHDEQDAVASPGNNPGMCGRLTRLYKWTELQRLNSVKNNDENLLERA